MSDTKEQMPGQAEAIAKVKALRQRIDQADPDTLALMLTEARTHYGWQDRHVTDAQLHRLYDIAKMGPTSMNQQPMRLVFVRGKEAKQKLIDAAMEANKEKIRTAPVTAIIGYDMEFFENLEKTFPINPDAGKMFEGNAEMAKANAQRNGTLQGAYLMLAARAIGLDCGPMSGFKNVAVDKAFFEGTAIKSNFLCNIGYGDVDSLFPRLPRLEFEEVAQIV